MFWSIVLGCTTTDASADCPTLAQPERDFCYADRIAALGAGEVDAVRENARAIEDGLVREAAVLAWLGDYADTVPLKDAEALCANADGQDSWMCQRRIHAAHLRRSKSP